MSDDNHNTAGMVEAREAIVRALVGPINGAAARLMAPVVLGAIVAGQIPGVSFTPRAPRDESPSYRAQMIDAGRGRLLR